MVKSTDFWNIDCYQNLQKLHELQNWMKQSKPFLTCLTQFKSGILNCTEYETTPNMGILLILCTMCKWRSYCTVSTTIWESTGSIKTLHYFLGCFLLLLHLRALKIGCLLKILYIVSIVHFAWFAKKLSTLSLILKS